jgi:hypothetical protein
MELLLIDSLLISSRYSIIQKTLIRINTTIMSITPYNSNRIITLLLNLTRKYILSNIMILISPLITKLIDTRCTLTQIPQHPTMHFLNDLSILLLYNNLLTTRLIPHNRLLKLNTSLLMH